MTKTNIRKSLASECARLESRGMGSTEQYRQSYRALEGECCGSNGRVNRSLVSRYLREAERAG